MRAISGTVDLGIMVPGHVSNPETKVKWIDGGQQFVLDAILSVLGNGESVDCR